ncbi:unnamed protein product [Ixodes hexagonus]
MRVKYATQVMSESVYMAILTLIAIGELPAVAKSTAEFLERMDKLRFVGQSGDKLRYAIKEQSEHLPFLEQCLPWTDECRFDLEGRRQPQTIKGWQVTTKGVRSSYGAGPAKILALSVS